MVVSIGESILSCGGGALMATRRVIADVHPPAASLIEPLIELGEGVGIEVERVKERVTGGLGTTLIAASQMQPALEVCLKGAGVLCCC